MRNLHALREGHLSLDGQKLRSPEIRIRHVFEQVNGGGGGGVFLVDNRTFSCLQEEHISHRVESRMRVWCSLVMSLGVFFSYVILGCSCRFDLRSDRRLEDNGEWVDLSCGFLDRSLRRGPCCDSTPNRV